MILQRWLLIPNRLVATEDGSGVTLYTGLDAGELTVGSEIYKLLLQPSRELADGGCCGLSTGETNQWPV